MGRFSLVNTMTGFCATGEIAGGVGCLAQPDPSWRGDCTGWLGSCNGTCGERCVCLATSTLRFSSLAHRLRLATPVVSLSPKALAVLLLA